MDYLTFNPREVSDGTTNEPLDPHNIPKHMAIAAFTGIAWYNVLELNISVYMVFRRKSGLYFWSVFLSIQGILLHSLAFILKLYGVVSIYQVTISMVTVGWYLMVTGQSLVLYSRLHLIVSELWIIRGVLFMIIWNAITLHIPTTVLTYGTNSPDNDDFRYGYRIMEKVQMTIFVIQESIISGIYIWATLRFLRPFYQRQIRSVMLQLLWINVAIIVMDLAMLVVEFLGYYSLEVAMKGAIYSVKLKVEFAVLNQLMRIAKASRETRLSGVDIDASDPASQNGKGFRGFLRRLLPRPNNDHIGEGKHHIDGPGALATRASGRNHRQRAPANGNISVISASKTGDEDARRGGFHGISVTKEITQVSNKMGSEGRLRNQGKPTDYYPGSADSRDASLDMDGVASDRSEVELVTLPLPGSSDTLEYLGSCEEVETAVPRRAAQPSWRDITTPSSRGASPHV